MFKERMAQSAWRHAHRATQVMMQSGNFSDDDYYGIWALWRRLVTGNYACGPGYVRAYNGNYTWDLMCKPGSGGGGGSGGSGGSGGGGGGTCTDQNANCSAWAARGECDKNPNYMLVYCCASCKAIDGGGGGSDCEYACSDYGYREGQCYRGWLCTAGCLDYIGQCPSDQSQCKYACEDYGFAEGECRNKWKCKNGCLRRVKKCKK